MEVLAEHGAMEVFFSSPNSNESLVILSPQMTREDLGLLVPMYSLLRSPVQRCLEYQRLLSNLRQCTNKFIPKLEGSSACVSPMH